MADQPNPLDSPRTRALVQRLLDDAVPVARLWRPGARLTVWIAGVIAIGVAVGSTGLRSDLPARLRDPLYLLELALLVAATALAAARAWEEAVPGPAGRRAGGGPLVLVAAAAVLWLVHPVHASAPVAEFVGRGLGCARRTFLLAALPWLVLFVGIRRGTPLAPLRAGLLTGVAAFAVAALLVRLVCPTDEPLHLVVWHGLPFAVGTAASAAIGLRWLRRRRRGALTSGTNTA